LKCVREVNLALIKRRCKKVYDRSSDNFAAKKVKRREPPDESEGSLR